MTISLSSLAVTYKSKLWRNKIATRWLSPVSPLDMLMSIVFPPNIMVSPVSPLNMLVSYFSTPKIMVSPVSPLDCCCLFLLPPNIVMSPVSLLDMLVSIGSPPNIMVSPVSPLDMLLSFFFPPNIVVSPVSPIDMLVSIGSPPTILVSPLLQEEDGQEGPDQQQVRHHLQPDHVSWHVRGAVPSSAGICFVIHCMYCFIQSFICDEPLYQTCNLSHTLHKQVFH